VLQIFCEYFKHIKSIQKELQNNLETKMTAKQNLAFANQFQNTKTKNINSTKNTKTKHLKKCQIFEKIAKIIQKSVKKLQKLAKNLQKIAKNINISIFDNQTKNIIKTVTSAKKVLMVGKNFDYVLALEASLKLKEISYISSEAYPSGELKHGTIALADNQTLVFAFITEKKLVDKTLNIAHQVEARGAKVVFVTPFENVVQNRKKQKTNIIILPQIEESFYPLISVIPMQLLAYKTSVALGNNPDKPRNLAKSVTVE
jgi:glucosamine--fructose-6-phosphate aminotransferase (isomerizing)